MLFRQLFDPATSTYTYLLADPQTRDAVLIDPVREQLDRDLSLLSELGLTLRYTLETHVHADHVTSSGVLRQKLGSQSVVSKAGGAHCADMQVSDGDMIQFGHQFIEVRATPGHTDGCVSYVTADRTRAFTGDALLIRGCGRTDFQQGDAQKLYRSIHDKLFTLPSDTAVYPGHDYKGRTSSTIGEEKAFNPRLGQGKSEADFVALMGDLNLPEPKHIREAVPANLVCGVDGEAADEGLIEHAVGRPFAPVIRTVTGVPEITVDWLAANPAAMRLVDVRERGEFTGELGHVDGAELVPLGIVAAKAIDWDRTAPLALICRSGGRSGRAALELERMGFRKVVSVAGGMLLWNRKALPISKALP